MTKRIILFDGTWNTLEDETNVVHLRDAIEQSAAQRVLYIPGVGTQWHERWRGGAFGRGLSNDILQGYEWLCANFAEGDEIFLFGFSRGAYSARSLIGLIRKCGLLVVPNESLIKQAYEIYRDKKIHPDDAPAENFRRNFSRLPRIRFIGVWDTVGALGIPLSGVPFSRDYYQWHDTELSKIVDYAYHAVALDEHRKDYDATVWTAKKAENLEVEQRWFIGAHGNVGGGYKNDPLPNLPLRWLQEKAKACGLSLTREAVVGREDYRAPITDTFGEFMFGLYRIFKGNKRFYRAIGKGVCETIDRSVWQRWDADAEYRPPALDSHAAKRDDLAPV
jgi:uncharacterized protein (DUF2235 family)